MKQVIVALVGRPNVGKSTLFNRLSLKEKSIVHDLPGITRDRKYAKARIHFFDFIVIDTPGLEQAPIESLEFKMTKQSLTAIEEANIICLIVDAISGILPVDKEFANLIRKYQKQAKIILVVNKAEKSVILEKEYYKLGLGEPVCISAKHGGGIYELGRTIENIAKQDDIFTKSSNERFNTYYDNKCYGKSDVIQLVIVGRPNVGKSTFINAVLNTERIVTDKEAGITRNSVEVDWQYKNQLIRLIDTAGLRKKNTVTEQCELLSVNDTLRNIRFANIVILMIDATRFLQQQDLNIVNYIIHEGRGIVLVINKWDLIREKKYFQEELDNLINSSLSQIKGIKPIYISAIEQFNLEAVLECCLLTYSSWNKKITTGKLNQWLISSTNQHPLPLQQYGKRIKIKYCTQIKTRPPTIKLFCNNIKDIAESYKRYLVNNLKHSFNIIGGVPVRLSFVKTKNPYITR